MPGTFDWQLHPVDDGFRPTISPEAAYADGVRGGRRPDATAVLAQVRNEFEDTVGPTAWVFVTPAHVLRDREGRPGLARTAPGDGCTDENLYVQGVDATTGEALGGFRAFDTADAWAPARPGSPAPVEARTQAGTTRLH